MPPTAISRQVGGDHYKGSSIQPIQFAMANRYDPCIFSAIKYVTRHHLKAGLEDVRKGAHFVQLKAEEGPLVSYSVEIVGVKDYCRANLLGVAETDIIYWLHEWALAGLDLSSKMHTEYAALLIRRFDVLAFQRYQVPMP